ncbi:MAG: molybdenum cofactor biosynthesis protein MoeA [Polaribacter sp.]|nr:MAG: molybdenum cofactor biosynthesis protein MoeA [Polaribacter sp.]
MKEIWNLIEGKLKEIAPKILKSLNKGVTDKDVVDLEETIDAKLPEDFVNAYKIYNGQSDYCEYGLIDCEELLSFSRILSEWEIWKGLVDDKMFEEDDGEPFTSEPEKGIKNDWYNPLWIPITYDGCGNHYCLDLDPAEDGTYGQIIRMWHDDGERSLEANSFIEWITNYKDKLLSGQFVYSDEYGGIIDKEELEELENED